MSIKQLLTLASAASALLLACSALLSLFVFSSAEEQLERTLRSYEQLAIATGLETDAARALLEELRQRDGGAAADIAGSRRRFAEDAIDALVSEIRDEIGSLRDPEEQAAEAEEFVAAFAIREDYRRLLRALERERAAGSAPDDEAFAHFDSLDGRLSAVVRDERGEVAEAMADLRAFRWKLQRYAMAAVAAAVAAIAAAAYLTYRFLMRPLRVLESGSAELASGNIAHRIAAAGPPEFQRLAVRLNEMAARLEEQRRALRSSKERLEVTVAERTAELCEKAETLQRIDESRRLFFAKVGHELRTPLTVLLGETQVALQTPDADAQSYREALTHIGENAEQLRRRIADLLILARSDEGRLSVLVEAVDVMALARDTVAATRGYAALSDVDLHLHDESGPVPARGDADRLRQAMLALIDNAVKFSPAGACVDVHVDSDASRVVVAVNDRGPGVPESELHRIKQPYFQGGDAPRIGTGLGLTVAAWVAEQHGGRLDAANREGGGLQVSLHLPAASAHRRPT